MVVEGQPLGVKLNRIVARNVILQKRSKFDKTFNMAIDKLKKELTKLIDETNDEDLLSMVKEDIAYYKTSRDVDVTDNLSAKQLKELEQLAAEPDEKDTMTLNEFNKATDKWRTKLFLRDALRISW